MLSPRSPRRPDEKTRSPRPARCALRRSAARRPAREDEPPEEDRPSSPRGSPSPSARSCRQGFRADDGGGDRRAKRAIARLSCRDDEVATRRCSPRRAAARIDPRRTLPPVAARRRRLDRPRLPRSAPYGTRPSSRCATSRARWPITRGCSCISCTRSPSAAAGPYLPVRHAADQHHARAEEPRSRRGAGALLGAGRRTGPAARGSALPARVQPPLVAPRARPGRGRAADHRRAGARGFAPG